MNFAVGSLVQARGREWVVLPESSRECVTLRPLGGSDEEIIGIIPALEEIAPATFELPSTREIGDARSCNLLRDAVRLGFRASSGPFRSFGHIAVEPRPYQLVPLLMAMKQDVVRLLVADDVGIGKTIESCLIARELLDRGEIRRMAVLCPPQLAEQWQTELEEKFHIQAKLVLPSTVRKLERGLGVGTSLFHVHPHVIVSLDYIKSDRHREEFLRTCPELVIVDEAHTCATANGGRARQQRFELVSGLARDPNRHMIFVSATPHSGKEDVFRSLLTFLNPEFAALPEDLSGKPGEPYRRQLAAHFVQRRRGDIRAYMDTATPFPTRESQEITWELSPEYHRFFEKVIRLARDTVTEVEGESRFHQRIKWWSALALLRAMASSPAAAAATLRSRAEGLDTETPEQADEIGRRTVFDLMDEESAESMDTAPGGDSSDLETDQSATTARRRRLNKLAREAEQLQGEADSKLAGMIKLARKLIKEGYAPVIFCRFIHTAEYVALHLREALKKVEVAAVTGLLPPVEREARVRDLEKHDQRILVCTDCLSEGINLQDQFNAVVHYDLSWNPTRHEQREGRVDRFGQPYPAIRVITYYGVNNQIDGIVLNVLLRKHNAIRKALGVSVPIPEDSDKVMQAILEGLLLKKKGQATPREKQLTLPGFEDIVEPERNRLEQEWDKVVRREEKRSRTLFAQQTIKVDEVGRELEAANQAAGNSRDVERFTLDALTLLGAGITSKERPTGNTAYTFDLSGLEPLARERLGVEATTLKAGFHLPVLSGETHLSRTHPFVERLASHIMDTSLDSVEKSIAKRCGVMRTSAVPTRTTLLLCRFRFQLLTRSKDSSHPALTEECALLGFTGTPDAPVWLDENEPDTLSRAVPKRNVSPDLSAKFITKVEQGMEHLLPHVHSVMEQRSRELLDAHSRVRTAARVKGLKYEVQPQGEPDILGIYILLPVLN